LLPPDVLAPRDVGLLNIACNVGRSAKVRLRHHAIHAFDCIALTR
jgi:hypothetical protein